MICDFYQCSSESTRVLSTEKGPFGKLCDAHFEEVSEKMKTEKWNLLVDKHVHTTLSLVERDPMEDILGQGFVPVAENGMVQ